MTTVITTVVDFMTGATTTCESSMSTMLKIAHSLRTGDASVTGASVHD